MDYVGCGFDWFFVLLSTGAYFYALSKTGKKWFFLLIFATGWIFFGVSYLLLIGGVSAGEWYITLIRTIGYALFTAMLFSLIVELTKSE